MFPCLGLGKVLADEIRDWDTAYSLTGEHALADNHLLTTLPRMTKEWKVSFQVKPTDYSFASYANVLHMTIGGKGLGSGSKVGDRTPAIWTHSTKGFLVASAVGGKFSYSKYFKALPSTDKWILIEVSQEMKENAMIYSITIGENEVLSVKNSRPSEFENVQVFASSSWYSPVNGFIKNLLIENKNEGRSKDNYIFLFLFINYSIAAQPPSYMCVSK